MPSIKLPLQETAKVGSIKLPIRETVWVLNGFIVQDYIVDWITSEFDVTENVKSRIIINAELIDKNHVKLTWYGEPVPKIAVYRRIIGESYSDPEVYLDWNDGEYIMEFDSNAYELHFLGINDTGESDKIQIGQEQDFDIDVYFELPLHEKYYYLEVDITSTYRIEVNL